MERALIIGSNSFVGSHLWSELEHNGYDVYGTVLERELISAKNSQLDITKIQMVEETLLKIKPDIIVVLSAVSSVSLSWRLPTQTMEVNILGTLNILESIRANGLKSKVLLVGSSEQYGFDENVKMPLNEIDECKPSNPYAISKNAQEQLGKLYSTIHNVSVVMTRSFNHIGPGQSPSFVVSSFAKQIAEIEFENKDQTILVGNLEAKRDFTDVRDVVRAYRLLLEKGKSGEIYNVGSGNSVRIKELLDILLSQSPMNISVEIDSNLYRPNDIPEVRADTSKIFEQTEWKPMITIEDSMKDILDSWRILTKGETKGAVEKN